MPLVAVVLCYSGGVACGEPWIKPLRDFAPPAVDLVAAMPYTALQSMFDESAPKGILSFWKTEYLRDLEDPTIDILIAQADKMPGPLSVVHIHHVGGAISRVHDDATAFAHREMPFILNVVGMWTTAPETDAQIAWVREFSRAVAPHSTGAQFLNFLAQEGKQESGPRTAKPSSRG
jgi:hypothetical protein